MKNKFDSIARRLALCSITILGVIYTTCAVAQKPPARVAVTPSSELKNVFYYELQFPGGDSADFFQFWRTNGFTNDTILFAGKADDVYIPSFKIKDARLDEVAKAIEFVTEDVLKVEIVQPTDRDRGNIWKIRRTDNAPASSLKTRACALPSLLLQENSEERVHRIIQEVERSLIIVAERLHENRGSKIPSGRCTILDSEKVIVVVGDEGYVEAIASALEAVEKATSSSTPPKKSQ